jgi:hypothetical protein
MSLLEKFVAESLEKSDTKDNEDDEEEKHEEIISRKRTKETRSHKIDSLTKKQKLMLVELSNEVAAKRVTPKNKKKKQQLKIAGSLLKKRLIIRSPRSGWIAFLMNRKKIDVTNPLKKVTKESSPIWAAMTMEEKEPYNKLYELDVKRYREDLAKLSPTELKFLKQQRKLKRKTKVTTVKRPRSCFMIYMNKNRAEVVEENPKLSVPQIAQLIGEKWKSLTPEERDIYICLAKEERIQYDQKIKEITDNNLQQSMMTKKKQKIK